MRHLISTLQTHNQQMKVEVVKYKIRLRETQAELNQVGQLEKLVQSPATEMRWREIEKTVFRHLCSNSFFCLCIYCTLLYCNYSSGQWWKLDLVMATRGWICTMNIFFFLDGRAFLFREEGMLGVCNDCCSFTDCLLVSAHPLAFLFTSICFVHACKPDFQLLNHAVNLCSIYKNGCWNILMICLALETKL